MRRISIEESASFAQLAGQGRHVVFMCMTGGRHWDSGTLRLSAAEAAERFGPETRLEAVRRRLRCKGCGYRGPYIVADVLDPPPPPRPLWSSRVPEIDWRGKPPPIEVRPTRRRRRRRH